MQRCVLISGLKLAFSDSVSIRAFDVLLAMLIGLVPLNQLGINPHCIRFIWGSGVMILQLGKVNPLA